MSKLSIGIINRDQFVFIHKSSYENSLSTPARRYDRRRATYKHVPSRSRIKRASQGLVEIMRFSKEQLLLFLKVRQSL